MKFATNFAMIWLSNVILFILIEIYIPLHITSIEFSFKCDQIRPYDSEFPQSSEFLLNWSTQYFWFYGTCVGMALLSPEVTMKIHNLPKNWQNQSPHRVIVVVRFWLATGLLIVGVYCHFHGLLGEPWRTNTANQRITIKIQTEHPVQYSVYQTHTYVCILG